MTGLDVKDAFVDVFAEFIDAYFQQILLLKKLFPKEAFEPRQIYGITASKARHPELNEYFAQSLIGIKKVLREGVLSQVNINITDEDKMVVERVALCIWVNYDNIKESEFYDDLCEMFRSILLKMQNIDMGDVSEVPGVSFVIEVETTVRDPLPVGRWHDTVCGPDKVKNLKRISPIRSCGLEDKYLIQVHRELP